jgi:hypothetical protein
MEDDFIKKRDSQTGIEISNADWQRFEKFLPQPEASPDGSQKYTPNRACLEGLAKRSKIQRYAQTFSLRQHLLASLAVLGATRCTTQIASTITPAA